MGGRELYAFSSYSSHTSLLPLALSLSKHCQVRLQRLSISRCSPQMAPATPRSARVPVNITRLSHTEWRARVASEIFCVELVRRSPDYARNLQNVPGHRGFDRENVNPSEQLQEVLQKPEKAYSSCKHDIFFKK